MLYNVKQQQKQNGLHMGDFGTYSISLFVLLLYVPSEQLWSLRDGQFT